MAVSRIEELIEDIYDFVEECKMQPLSSTKVIVPKDELYDLLDELRLRTPDEIKRYKKMLENKDAILQDAEAKAIRLFNKHRCRQSRCYHPQKMMQIRLELVQSAIHQIC